MGRPSPRFALGISLDHAAEVIGVNRATLSRFELNPQAVRPDIRERIEAFYGDLARAFRAATQRRETAATRTTTGG